MFAGVELGPDVGNPDHPAWPGKPKNCRASGDMYGHWRTRTGRSDESCPLEVAGVREEAPPVRSGEQLVARPRVSDYLAARGEPDTPELTLTREGPYFDPHARD
jgi:hypothetical protein